MGAGAAEQGWGERGGGELGHPPPLQKKQTRKKQGRRGIKVFVRVLPGALGGARGGGAQGAMSGGGAGGAAHKRKVVVSAVRRGWRSDARFPFPFLAPGHPHVTAPGPRKLKAQRHRKALLPGGGDSGMSPPHNPPNPGRGGDRCRHPAGTRRERRGVNPPPAASQKVRPPPPSSHRSVRTGPTAGAAGPSSAPGTHPPPAGDSAGGDARPSGTLPGALGPPRAGPGRGDPGILNRPRAATEAPAELGGGRGPRALQSAGKGTGAPGRSRAERPPPPLLGPVRGRGVTTPGPGVPAPWCGVVRSRPPRPPYRVRGRRPPGRSAAARIQTASPAPAASPLVAGGVGRVTWCGRRRETTNPGGPW